MDKLKTFFVFAFNDEAPKGGMYDFCDSFSTETEARTYIEKKNLRKDYENVSIVNVKPYLQDKTEN